MATTQIPTSKAKTAYSLLSDIAKLAVDEPRRMRMQSWGGEIGNAYWMAPDMRPACNTVGCIGGWTNVLRRGPSAESVLGLTSEQADELFFGPLVQDENQGSRRHALKVAAMIRKFQKKYRAQLLKTKV